MGGIVLSYRPTHNRQTWFPQRLFLILWKSIPNQKYSYGSHSHLFFDSFFSFFQKITMHYVTESYTLKLFILRHFDAFQISMHMWLCKYWTFLWSRTYSCMYNAHAHAHALSHMCARAHAQFPFGWQWCDQWQLNVTKDVSPCALLQMQLHISTL